MGTDERMTEQQVEWSGQASGLESVRDLHLAVLAQGLVDELGPMRAAQKLGVDRKTLWRCRKTGELTPRLREALERLLRAEEASALARAVERLDALELRLGELDRGLDSRLDAAVRQAREQGAEASRALRGMERRLDALGARENPRADDTQEPGVDGRTAATAGANIPPRVYPELVSLQPEPGDEAVFGDAMATVTAWREARAAYARSFETGPPLRRALDRERALVLELELVEERELTLDPATYPWDWAGRRDQALRRRRALEEAREDQASARRRWWMRKILSLGLWRGEA